MARQAIKAQDVEVGKAEREQRKRGRLLQKQTREKIVDKTFADMTRAEKDDLLYLLCQKAGILPKGE